jgi:hypothetical protein
MSGNVITQLQIKSSKLSFAAAAVTHDGSLNQWHFDTIEVQLKCYV